MVDENIPLSPEQMAARIAELEGRLAKGSALSFKVSEKGAVSVYFMNGRGESRGASQPRALAEPDRNLSIHPAPIIRPQVPGASEQKAGGCDAVAHATTSRSPAGAYGIVCICAWPTAR